MRIFNAPVNQHFCSSSLVALVSVSCTANERSPLTVIQRYFGLNFHFSILSRSPPPLPLLLPAVARAAFTARPRGCFVVKLEAPLAGPSAAPPQVPQPSGLDAADELMVFTTRFCFHTPACQDDDV